VFDLIEIIRKYNKKNKIQKLYYVIEFVTLFFFFLRLIIDYPFPG